ncbi:LppM family (lipo)protein [Nocardioides sp. AE5]|uniref:LppM family (lipo)protein n=1 Tax=Nocardioides sp. AE5 TaxID=2962573 RepID=UPI00288135AF|nr:hypothetical protein [Nocardioides sp. AE5]MDT0203818.1 hypothetical protein [Nocardioides sp. AE5]
MHGRVARSALVAVLLLFVTAGCFRMQMEMTVNEDETLSGSLVTAMSEEALVAMAAFDEAGSSDPRALWEEFNEGNAMDLPPGATVEEYAEDGYIGDRIVFADTPISQMDSVLSADGGEFSLVHEGDTYVFSMDFSVDNGAMGGGDLISESEMNLFASLYGKPELIVDLTFPGEVIETNGEVDGTTVTWTRDLLASGNEPMTATAKDSGGNTGGNSGGSGGGDGGTGGESGGEAGEDDKESGGTAGREDSTAAVASGVALGAAVLALSLLGMGMGVHRALRG